MRQLGWQEIGPREFALIDAMIQRSVGAIGGGSDGAVSP